ncbi:jg11731 [Pararge aegeria aegeria]|uniref:Jg11731 protein n=1 Tax=Pararge aegeria aegeria TaxID=348720 RepID=A0A8S4R1W9_9NEOP|nr:jg11731 [Pararge aegeria aegeria]
MLYPNNFKVRDSKHKINECELILERGECHPPRMDDAFLLCFLRARRSIPARAHRLMVRYCNFREQNPHLWSEVSWYGLRRLGNVFEGVLFDRPDVGRLIICRIGETKL